jgi:hypothetical protein
MHDYGGLSHKQVRSGREIREGVKPPTEVPAGANASQTPDIALDYQARLREGVIY